jgi:hypothetical protein
MSVEGKLSGCARVLILPLCFYLIRKLEILVLGVLIILLEGYFERISLVGIG